MFVNFFLTMGQLKKMQSKWDWCDAIAGWVLPGPCQKFGPWIFSHKLRRVVLDLTARGLNTTGILDVFTDTCFNRKCPIHTGASREQGEGKLGLY